MFINFLYLQNTNLTGWAKKHKKIIVLVTSDLDMRMFTMESVVWQFALRPQVGVLISTPSADLILAAKYFNGFKANDTEDQQYFTINVGLVF